MGQPTWRVIVKALNVPEREGIAWTRALDYLSPNKLYLIAVAPQEEDDETAEQSWIPEGSASCTADGDPSLTRDEGLVLATCCGGALIARIGGSSANQKLDAARTTIFAVGRHCVFSVSDTTKVGSLYLGMNDSQKSMTKVAGRLKVTISEGL